MNLLEALGESIHTTAILEKNGYSTVVDGSEENDSYVLTFGMSEMPPTETHKDLTLGQVLAHSLVRIDKDSSKWEPHTEEI
jgi:hypothetical protein